MFVASKGILRYFDFDCILYVEPEQNLFHGQAFDRAWSFRNCSFEASRRKKRGKKEKREKKKKDMSSPDFARSRRDNLQDAWASENARRDPSRPNAFPATPGTRVQASVAHGSAPRIPALVIDRQAMPRVAQRANTRAPTRPHAPMLAVLATLELELLCGLF